MPLIFRILALFAASNSSHSLDQQQYADIKRYLPDDILYKVDRMSMAVSGSTRSISRLHACRVCCTSSYSHASTWYIGEILT